MFHALIFSGIEMTFTSIQKGFVCNSCPQSNKTAQRAFVIQFHN